jgi:polysaccharide pyruvyl transferase WcaK-like protein
MKGKKNYNILLWKNKIWESKVSNTGDLAIILNTIIKLREIFPCAQIHMFSDDPEYVQSQYGVKAYPVRQIFNPFKLYQSIKRMDLVILGGGTVLQDNYFIGVIPINLSIPLIPKFLKKKVACNAIGVGSENEITGFGRRFSTFALKRFDSITVRDQESKDLLEKWLQKRIPVVLTNDIATDLPSVDFQIFDNVLRGEGVNLEEKPTIAVAARKIFHHEKSFLSFFPSSLRVNLGLLNPVYKRRHKEFQVCLANFCDYVIQKYDVNIIFIPFYSSGGSVDSKNVGSPKRLFTSSDNIFAEEVFGKIKNKRNVKILRKNYKPDEIVTIISKCKALIGVPYHSVVFASSRNVPVIGIGYVSKIQRYMKILDLEEYLIPARIEDGVSSELLKRKFDQLWENRESIVRHLARKNKILYELANKNISILKGVLYGSEGRN